MFCWGVFAFLNVFACEVRMLFSKKICVILSMVNIDSGGL